MRKSFICFLLSLILLFGCAATFSQSGNAETKAAPADSLNQDQNYQDYEDLLEVSKEVLEEPAFEPVIEPDPSQPNIFE